MVSLTNSNQSYIFTKPRSGFSSKSLAGVKAKNIFKGVKEKEKQKREGQSE